MSACEKCWTDAYNRSIAEGIHQADAYGLILEERIDSPCTAEEQAGQWWDPDLKIDSRIGEP